MLGAQALLHDNFFLTPFLLSGLFGLSWLSSAAALRLLLGHLFLLDFTDRLTECDTLLPRKTTRGRFCIECCYVRLAHLLAMLCLKLMAGDFVHRFTHHTHSLFS